MKNTKELFNITIDKPDDVSFAAAKHRFDGKAKPIDGLGDLETIICRIAAVQRTGEISLRKRAAVIMCADNGIVEEGISQSGKKVTFSVAAALGKGLSSACTLARSADVDVVPVDIGIDSDLAIPGVRNMKSVRGTGNFMKEPAMTDDETLHAIDAGIRIVKELSDEGYTVIAAGEMGIGNTTTSAAVISAFLNIDSDEVTGRGAGIDDEGLNTKKQVIKRGVELYKHSDISDTKNRAFQILKSLGGLDMAGAAGLMIGGAICHVPVILDGILTAAAALVAEGMLPGVKDYLIASHNGREKGIMPSLEYLGLRPVINGNMALGEGTGAILLFPLLDAAVDYYYKAADFRDYGMDEYKRFR
ncbi:MAG: nicotinate-nucleotide--dimethylbenzimidazole phosphoribosyltransferase [Lachnospiraceae bacterium]|nr:nicotinate-nucleotide--dimethylbenzimidazole phosphoribosyltransferase [Lachnospiraceae bacterium]